MRIRRATASALALAAATGLAACGEEDDHVNAARPAPAINVTAAIIDGRVNVSPRRFGAGPIRLIVTNQEETAQSLTFETAGGESGVTRTTPPIRPGGTATIEVGAVDRGAYELSTADRGVEPATVTVGAPRPSGQDRLLLP